LEIDQWLGLEGDGKFFNLKFLLDFVHTADKALNTAIAETNQYGVAITMASFILVRKILKNTSRIFFC
jgi:hypothetical protein